MCFMRLINSRMVRGDRWSWDGQVRKNFISASKGTATIAIKCFTPGPILVFGGLLVVRSFWCLELNKGVEEDWGKRGAIYVG